MRALLSIPAQIVPLVTDALRTVYAEHASAIAETINGDGGENRREQVGRRRAGLLEVDELLEQLDFSDERRSVEIAGERDVLATAIYLAHGSGPPSRCSRPKRSSPPGTAATLNRRLVGVTAGLGTPSRVT